MGHEPISGTGASPRALNLQENCQIAKATVKYVKKSMPIGAANKGFDWFWHWSGLWTTEAGECLAAVRADLKKFKQQAARKPFEIIKFNAERALKSGCGNCDEQSMVAFMYLYKNNVRPVDLLICPKVHVFVVLGRKEKSDPARIGTWGKNAVICDPWDGMSYPAFMRPKKMSCIDSEEMMRTKLAFRAD